MGSKLKEQIKGNRGQILVIVLIVMMILAIIVVSVTNNSIRDIQQAEYNSQYEELYSISETRLLDVAHSIPIITKIQPEELKGKIEVALTDSGVAEKTCEVVTDQNCVLCTINNGNDNYTKLKTCTNTTLRDVVLKKDEIVVFNLEGLTIPDSQIFTISWTNNTNAKVGVEVSFDFQYNSFSKDGTPGETLYSSVRAMCNPDNVFGTTTVDRYFGMQPTEAGSKSCKFKYTDLIAALNNYGSATNTIKHLTDPVSTDTTKINSTITPLGFHFRPFVNTQEDVTIELTVSTLSDLNKTQSITYEATSYSLKDGRILGAQPFVQTSIPIHKPPALFDYVLRSKESLEAPTAP